MLTEQLRSSNTHLPHNARGTQLVNLWILCVIKNWEVAYRSRFNFVGISMLCMPDTRDCEFGLVCSTSCDLECAKLSLLILQYFTAISSCAILHILLPYGPLGAYDVECSLSVLRGSCYSDGNIYGCSFYAHMTAKNN